MIENIVINFVWLKCASREAIKYVISIDLFFNVSPFTIACKTAETFICFKVHCTLMFKNIKKTKVREREAQVGGEVNYF